jgi:hypothetical protein
MEKQQIGSLGLSPRSVEQLERVIDTADTVLYPAVLLAVYGVCYGLWWVCDSIYQHGMMITVADICRNVAVLVKGFPYVSAANHQVGWLDVAVNDPRRVCRVQCVCDLDAQIEHGFDLQWLVSNQVT